MFIDYVTLLLVNMAAGYGLLSAYVFRGLDDPDQKRWGLAFLPVGLVALGFGAQMTVTWPLPGPFNSAYGELSVLFGVIFLVAGIGLLTGRDLTVLAGYAALAGADAVLFGVRFISLSLTPAPVMSGLGIIISGLGGVGMLPVLTCCRQHRAVRTVAALVMLAAALMWAFVAVRGVWGHMDMFGKWLPATMK
jgi:putative membrane protein